MIKFDLYLVSWRSSYFAPVRNQLPILATTVALDEEKWIKIIDKFVKEWIRYEIHFAHGRGSLVGILHER